MAIRFDKKFRGEIDSIVNRYNAKITRLKKKGYVNLPERFTESALKSLKKSTKNRADLKRKLMTLQDFTTRGGEKIVNYKGRFIPKFKAKTIDRYRNLLSRRLKAKEKFAKTTHETILGERDTFTIAQQFDTEYANIEATRKRLIDIDISKIDVDEYINKLQANTRTYNLNEWQRNYLEMIDDVAELNNIKDPRLNDLKNRLKNLTPKNFDELIKTERTLKQLIYYYKQIEDLGLVGAFFNQEDEAKEIFNEVFNNMDKIISDYEEPNLDDLFNLK